MAASKSVPGGELELALLQMLWERGDATARQLYETLSGSRAIVYTTVAKVLDRLVEKRLVRRRLAGKAYVYRAVARSEPTQRALARGLIERLSRGGPRPAVAALVGAVEDISPELLDELEAEIRAARKRRHGA